MSKHLDDFLSAAVTLATSPSELPAGFPGQPSVREKQNRPYCTYEMSGVWWYFTNLL